MLASHFVSVFEKHKVGLTMHVILPTLAFYQVALRQVLQSSCLWLRQAFMALALVSMSRDELKPRHTTLLVVVVETEQEVAGSAGFCVFLLGHMTLPANPPPLLPPAASNATLL